LLEQPKHTNNGESISPLFLYALRILLPRWSCLNSKWFNRREGDLSQNYSRLVLHVGYC